MTATDDLERRLLELTLEAARNGHNDAPAATQAPISDDPDDALRAMLIDWPTFWAHDHTDAEWLAEPVLPAGRSVALFAPGGTGKSLLALWLSAMLAAGRDPFTGRRQPPVDVLYLDYEMTEADLSERLEQMGFGPDHDLDHLHYALLPSLPGLDQPDGGRAVVRLAELCAASLVIIDTFGRAVHGDENDADTVRAWYRWTGLHLKAEGRAFMRVDHAGKDKTKGQRGTSGKNDDVDVVWELTAKDAGAFSLSSKWKRRMSWVPLTVDLLQTDEPLAYQLANGETWPAGTKECADVLDELGVALEASTRNAARTLSEAGRGARMAVVRAALKHRRRAAETLTLCDNPQTQSAKGGSRESGTHLSYPQSDPLTDPPRPDDLFDQVDESGPVTGPSGTHLPSSQTVGGSHVVGPTAGRTPPDEGDLF